MRRKIQRSMCLVAFLALLISGILTVAAVYQQTVMNKTRRTQAGGGIYSGGSRYCWRRISECHGQCAKKRTRLTLVGQDGTVLYDSVQDDTTLENHKNRKEIKGAMENGTRGSSKNVRYTWTKDVLLCDPTAGWDGSSCLPDY
mgnify:CR=1 FL=1